jgi:hypothetical protein
MQSEMQKAIDAQQQQIEQLRHELENRDQALQQLQQRLDQSQATATDAQGKADAAAAKVSEQQQEVGALRVDVADLKQNSINTAVTLQETQKSVTELESPLALHYKGITITPGGFLAAETVWRQKALVSDINTPFNSLPLPSSSQSDISEFFGTGRQSRISMLAEGNLKSAKLSGYVEADFLSAPITANNNESNSYSLRQRQAWGQAALTDGWSFTGGQMWSLVTETKNGVDNRTEAVPMTIDPAYNVGFSWARQYGFRIAKDFGNKFWFAFAAENPQTTFSAHGNGNNFLLGNAGTTGGTYNSGANYSFNAAPDLIAKLVFQPSKVFHFEIYGIEGEFRDRVFPNNTTTTSSAAGAYNSTTVGGGLGYNLRVNAFHEHIAAGLHFLGGNGIGRYGTAGLPDATVRPDGRLALIRDYQSLATLEYHDKKLDIYANVGGEYADHNWQTNSSGKAVGYGSPLFSNAGCFAEAPPSSTGTSGFLPGAATGCTGDTRNVIEGTLGFWYRFYKGPKGTIQWGPQYSYVVRNTWSGVGGQQPYSADPMILTSFRYYLP